MIHSGAITITVDEAVSLCLRGLTPSPTRHAGQEDNNDTAITMTDIRRARCRLIDKRDLVDPTAPQFPLLFLRLVRPPQFWWTSVVDIVRYRGFRNKGPPPPPPPSHAAETLLLCIYIIFLIFRCFCPFPFLYFLILIQAWSSSSPRGQWSTEGNGGNWLRNHLWYPNGRRD